MPYRDDTACAILESPARETLARPGRVRGVSFERRLSAWILLAATACFAALAAPFFAGRVYVADDLGEFHLPVRDFYAGQLAQGEPFDWMPSLYGGFDIAGEGQLGGYHPWHLFLYRFLPLGAAFDVELLAGYPLMFVGACWLFMRLVRRRDAALLGALVFTFGGFNLLHFVHPNAIAVVAHLPWLLAAIDVALSTTSLRRRAVAELGIGLLTASQLLLGYPQYVWFSLLAQTAFVAWRLVGGTAPLARLASLAVAVALGVAAGAVQWLPTMHVLNQSTRHDAGAAFANNGSLDPLNLVQLLAPYLFRSRVVGQNTHELGLYVGAVPIVLCLWLVAHRRRWGRFRPLVRALLVFGGLALLMAAGEFGPLYQLQAWVPLARSFRFPCRAIVLVQLCMAGGTAVAAAMLLERTTDARDQKRRIALWAALAASVILAILGPIIWPEFAARPALVWTGPLLIGAAVVLVAAVECGVRGSAIALVLFTAADLSAYGLSYSVLARTADLRDYVAAIKLPPDNENRRVVAPNTRGAARVGDRMLLAGLLRVDGYAGLEPKKRLDYRQRRTWQLAGVGWAWLAADDRQSKRTWVRVSPTAPRARLVTRAIDRERLEDAEALSFDAAVIEPLLSLPPSSPGSARIVDDAPGRITIETNTLARQLLVTTESFDSRWQVTIDGRPGAIVRVDGDFLGCPLEAGNHRVRFDFRPRYRQLGVLVSACGLGLLVLACCFRVFIRRPRRDGEGLACCEKL